MNQFEKNLNAIANLADTASTVSLFFGQPELAAGFTAVSFTASAVRAGSQLYRGDVAGAETTAAGAAISFGVSRISNVLKIGGISQKNFNAGVASGLGQAYGTGLSGLVGCS